MLRPYQQDAINQLRARGDKRLILWWGTSAGKTLAAIAAAQSVGAKRILVVCPAMARPNWFKEFRKWAPELDPQPIVYGLERKSLTKKQAAARDAAYAADVQIISYDLCHEEKIVRGAYDFIIVDELHALRSPTSLQSHALRALLNAHSGYALGLTATLIPTEVQNVWNQVDTFFPGFYGARTKTGAHSWKFLGAFCNRHENEYGTAYSGAKMEALPELRELLAAYSHRVTEADFSHYLPPVNADILWIDTKRADKDIARDWLDEKLAEVSHLALISYHHDLAGTLRTVAEKTKRPTFAVSGLETAERRQATIDAAAAAPEAILVATSESIRESIDLSFVDAALIFEWRTSPAAALQLSGRFGRSNRTKPLPTCIRYVAHPDDESRAEKLKTRIDAVNSAAKADAKSTMIADVFKARALTEDRLDAMFESMMSEVHLSLVEGDDDE